jgi:O-antigen ligase
MVLPSFDGARQFGMFRLAPLVAALVPLAICPGVLAYFDITPKSAILLVGAALIILYSTANMSDVKMLLKTYAGRALVGLLAAEWLLFAITSVGSTNRQLSLGGGAWRRFGLIVETGMVLFVFLAAAWLMVEVKRTRLLLRAAVLSGGLTAVYGIAQYFGWDPLLPAPAYHVGEGIFTIVRPPGTLGHADYFGVWLVAVFFLGLAVRRLETARALRIGAAGVSGSAAMALVMTGTRAALLGVALGGVVFLIARRQRFGVRTWAAGLACSASLALFFFSPAGVQLRARLHWSREDARGGARLLLWRDSVRMAAQRPLIGFGPETFGTEFPRYESAELAAAYPDFYHESPHNMFLDAFASQGVGGWMVLLALCALGALAAIRACKAANPLGPPLAGALFGVIAAQQFMAFVVATSLWFHLLIAMLVVVAWKPVYVRSPQESRWLWIPSGVIAALLIAAAVQMVVADRMFAIAEQRMAAGDISGAAAEYTRFLRWQPAGAGSDLRYSLEMQQAALRTPIFVSRALAAQQAFEAGVRAVTTAEDRQNAWYNLAALFAVRNDASGTERALRNAIAWAPNWFKPHWALARLLALAGHNTEARTEAQLATQLDGGRDQEVTETLTKLMSAGKVAH